MILYTKSVCAIFSIIILIVLQTLSRVTNWPNMTAAERERTFRVLVARNQSVPTQEVE